MKDLSRKWQHRDRIINKRTRLVKNVFSVPKDHVWLKEPGRLYKYNLKCTCFLCKKERFKRPDAGEMKKMIEGGEDE